MMVYQSLVSRLEDLLTSVTQEHGRATQAEFLVRYEYLLTLLDIAAKDPTQTAELEGLTYHFAREVQRAYGAMQPDPRHPAWCSQEGTEPVLRFDATVFAELYAERARELKCELVRLDERTALDLRELVPYVYVLDLLRSVILWPRPLDVGQVALARDPLVDADPVTHPMLVPADLAVLCAGELILIKDSNGVSRTVVANTRSGHFRPPPRSARYLRDALTTHLSLPSPESVVIFTAFDDRLQADPFR